MNKVKSMAETIGEALRLIQRLGGDITGMSLDNNNPTEHYVNHKFRDTIVIPFAALHRNIDFVMNKGEKYILTADGIRAKVMSWEEKHICELEDKIRELYGIDILTYLKRWHKATNGNMDSMHFLILKLKKE